MKYGEMKLGTFKERPNRFIAYCEVDGTLEKVHVKNTGKCKELLVLDAKVYLEVNNNPARKTKYSLITIEKGKRLINMDSQAPNSVAEEALKSGVLILPDMEMPLSLIKREKQYGHSRFDFYLESGDQKAYMEVKGVTLEEDDYVMFPDARTERGVKHIEELIKAKEEGYQAYLLFVIQMKEIRYFTPHVVRHPEFAEALKKAQEAGVHILAYECEVSPDTLVMTKPVKVIL